MPSILDLGYVALIVIAWPIYLYFVAWPRFLRRVRERGPDARLRQYWTTVGRQWLLVAIGVALWVRAGRAWSAFGLRVPSGWRLTASVAVVVLAAITYGWNVARVARSSRVREGLRKSKTLTSLEALLPHTTQEFASFLAAALTAGICEEFLFRGYVISALAPWIGWWGAAAAASVAFGLSHAYQGRMGVLRTGLVGVFMALVVAATGSLLPAMAVHALVDVGSGSMTWLVLKEKILAGEGSAR